MAIPDLAAIEESLVVRGGEGPHPAVIDPGRVDEHLDSIPSLMRRKMALEE